MLRPEYKPIAQADADNFPMQQTSYTLDALGVQTERIKRVNDANFPPVLVYDQKLAENFSRISAKNASV